jgi:hypothetical protein
MSVNYEKVVLYLFSDSLLSQPSKCHHYAKDQALLQAIPSKKYYFGPFPHPVTDKAALNRAVHQGNGGDDKVMVGGTCPSRRYQEAPWQVQYSRADHSAWKAPKAGDGCPLRLCW